MSLHTVVGSITAVVPESTTELVPPLKSLELKSVDPSAMPIELTCTVLYLWPGDRLEYAIMLAQ